MCYNQTGNIATLDGASLKLVDKFTYLGSSVSSTEKDIDTILELWVMNKKNEIILHHMDAYEAAGEEAGRKNKWAVECLKLYKFDEPDTRDTAGEARTSS